MVNPGRENYGSTRKRIQGYVMPFCEEAQSCWDYTPLVVTGQSNHIPQNTDSLGCDEIYAETDRRTGSCVSINKYTRSYVRGLKPLRYETAVLLKKGLHHQFLQRVDSCYGVTRKLPCGNTEAFLGGDVAITRLLCRNTTGRQCRYTR